MENFFKIEQLFSLEHTLAASYLKKFENSWEALSGLKAYIRRIGLSLDKSEYDEISPEVWVHKTVNISPTAYLGAPCIIGENAEIRHGAFIRGSALVGKNCVVGNSTELKNSILFDSVQVPHFNYIGDSILGYRAHLGAGAITSNVKCDKTCVTVNGVQTGLKKLGAIIGDGVEVGCNSVLNPGTVIGKNTTVYPLSCVRGVIPSDSILKNGEVTQKR